MLSERIFEITRKNTFDLVAKKADKTAKQNQTLLKYTKLFFFFLITDLKQPFYCHKFFNMAHLLDATFYIYIQTYSALILWWICKKVNVNL